MSVIPAIALFLLTQTSQPADRPPRLDFKNPPDYFAWYNQFAGRGCTSNAAERYNELASETRLFTDRLSKDSELKEDFEKLNLSVWNPDEHVALDSFCKEQRRLVDQFKEVARINGYWIRADPTKTTLLAIELPPLTAIRHLPRLTLVVSFRRSKNQSATILDALRTVLQSSRQYDQTLFATARLVANSNREYAFKSILQAHAADALADKDARDEFELISGLGHSLVPFQNVVLIEWASSLSVLSYACPKGHVDPEKLFDALGQEAVKDEDIKSFLAQQSNFSPSEITRKIDAAFEAAASITSGDPTTKKSRALNNLINTTRSEIGDPMMIFPRIVSPSCSREYELEIRSETLYRGTLLTLALNIHHAETGQWPARLDDIKAVSIKEFRTDLYSVKDFVYKLKNGKPLLYCVGVDGKDNGGETHDGHFGEKIKNSDYIFFPMPPKP